METIVNSFIYFKQAIGTSTSIIYSESIWFPTITVCSVRGPKHAFFMDGVFFESGYPPTNSEENSAKTNISFAPTPDLNEILYSIAVNLPNVTTFRMSQSDFKNRDAA